MSDTASKLNGLELLAEALDDGCDLTNVYGDDVRWALAEIRRLQAEVAQADGVAEIARGTIRELRARVAELERATPMTCQHCIKAPAVMHKPHPVFGGDPSHWCHKCFAWAGRDRTTDADDPVAAGVAELDREAG